MDMSGIRIDLSLYRRFPRADDSRMLVHECASFVLTRTDLLGQKVGMANPGDSCKFQNLAEICCSSSMDRRTVPRSMALLLQHESADVVRRSE